MPLILHTPNLNINLNNYFNSKKKTLNSENKLNNSNVYDLDTFIEICLNFDNSDLTKSFNHLLILPTHKQRDFIDRKLTDSYFDKWNKPSPNFGVNSFQKFVNILYTSLIPIDKYSKISDNFQLALIEQALLDFTDPNSSHYESLTYYNSEFLINNPQNLNKIKMGINALRNKGITSKEVFEEIKSYGFYNQKQNKFNDYDYEKEVIINKNTQYLIHNINKLKDFCLILSNYETKLGNFLIDNHATMDLLCQELENNKEIFKNFNSILKINTKTKFHTIKEKKLYDLVKNQILFYGFTEFEIPEIKLINKLKDVGFKICLHFDFTEFNGKLFDNIDRITNDFQNTKNEINFYSRQFETMDDIKQQINDKKTKNIKPSLFLKNYLFNNNKDEITSKEIALNTQIYKVKNKYLEVEYISQLCQYLLDTNNNLGIEPNDIVICSRNPQKYADIFRESGIKNNLQFNISDRFKLSNSKVVTDIINFIQILENDIQLTHLENDFEKLANFSYLKIDETILNFYNINHFFNNKSIIYSNPKENIIDKLLNLKKLYQKEILEQEEIKIFGNENYKKVNFENFIEGNSYSTIQNNINKIDKAILEIVKIYNYLNIFDFLENKNNEINIDELLSLNKLDNYLLINIDDIELYNSLPEINQHVIYKGNEVEKHIKIPNFKQFFDKKYSISEFESIIVNIINKYKVLNQILILRHVIVNEASSSNLDLNLDFLNDFENIYKDEFNAEILFDNLINNLSFDNLENDNSYLVEKFNFIKQNIKNNIYENLENDVKAYKNFFLVLDELKLVTSKLNSHFYNIQKSEAQSNIDNFEDNYVEHLKSKDPTINTFSDWFLKFKTLLSNSKYQINERVNKTINVTSIEQTRGIDYKVSIMCGLTHDEFPLKFQSDKMIGKDLENSQEKFDSNEKMLLYFFFNNGIHNLQEIEDSKNLNEQTSKNNQIKKLYYIFVPEIKGNKKLIDSTFLDEILLFLNNSENSFNTDDTNLSSDKSKNYNLLLNENYVMKLKNKLTDLDFNNLNINNNKPIINNWLTNLIDKNIYLNKNSNDVNLIYLNNFRTYLHSNKKFKYLLKYLKKANFENKVFNISNLSYFVEAFTKNSNNYAETNFSMVEKTFLENIMDLKFVEPISFEIEKKEQGTFFHNVVEIMIGFFRDKLLKGYSDIIISNEKFYKNDKFNLNNENIRDFVLKITDNKNSEHVSNENEDTSKFLIKIDKNRILELFILEIKNQLLKSFPNSIYIEFQILNYTIVAKNFIEFLLNESKNGRYILFSELNLVEDKLKGHIYEIENIDLKIKFKGIVDLIIADFSKQTVKTVTNNGKKGNENIILDNSKVDLEENFQFNIYDMKFKKSENIEKIQLFLYYEAFKSLLTDKNINNNIKDLGLIYLKENLSRMYKSTTLNNEVLPNSYIKVSQNKIEIAFNNFINNNLQ